jgi:hypothetical protein
MKCDVVFSYLLSDFGPFPGHLAPLIIKAKDFWLVLQTPYKLRLGSTSLALRVHWVKGSKVCAICMDLAAIVSILRLYWTKPYL